MVATPSTRWASARCLSTSGRSTPSEHAPYLFRNRNKEIRHEHQIASLSPLQFLDRAVVRAMVPLRLEGAVGRLPFLPAMLLQAAQLSEARRMDARTVRARAGTDR